MRKGEIAAIAAVLAALAVALLGTPAPQPDRLQKNKFLPPAGRTGWGLLGDFRSK